MDIHRTDDTQHQEPEKHYRTKRTTDNTCAKTLYQEQYRYDTNTYWQYWIRRIDNFQSLNGRCDSDSRSYYTISNKRSCTNNGYNI